MEHKTYRIVAVILSLSVLLNACIIPKDARQLKRTTKAWRESPIVLHAWADTPFSGIFLTLRENGKFEHTSTGMLGSFQAGTWASSSDTIRLIYMDSRQNKIRNQDVLLDKRTSTLVFEGDSTPVQMRLRITTNKIQ